MAIVAMAGKANVTSESDECIVEDTGEGSEGGDFDWDSNTQGTILGAFFYGYIITQIPAGILAEKFGGKWMFGCGTLITAVLTLLTPVSAHAGVGWLVANRVLMGLGEGVTFPSMHAMIAKWIPPKERSKLGSLIWAGAQAGTVVSLPVSGYLADDLGWESVFYVFGVLGIIWFVFWIFFCFNSPAEHPRISKEERDYIESHIPSDNEQSSLPFPPLLKIFSSLPFLSLIVVHFGQNWGFYTLLTETPTYLNEIQHFSLKTNGLLSALPYLCMWIFSICIGSLADYLIASKKISVINSRKLFNTIGFIIPALGLVWLSWVGCDRVMAIAALCVAVGFNGAIYSGFQVNHVDLSPNYAGTLMGITNMFANICGFVTPAVAGALTNNNQTSKAWRSVFLLSTGVYLVCDLVFVIFGKADVQPWNTHWEN